MMIGRELSGIERQGMSKAAVFLLAVSTLALPLVAKAEPLQAVDQPQKIKKSHTSSGSEHQKKKTLRSNAPRPVEELETLTVTDDRYNRLNTQAGTQADPTYKSEFLTLDPVTINTISQEDLETVKFTDPYEVLNRVPGVTAMRNLRYPIGGKGYTVNLMDGISVRDPLRGQVSDIENFDTDEIQRIEVTKGPASAIFPSNAFGGVINVITRDPPLTPQHRLWMDGGGNGITDRFRGGASTAGRFGDFGYRAGFNIWDVPGWRVNTGRSREVGSAKFSFQPDEVSKLTFRGEYKHEIDMEGNSLKKNDFLTDPRQAKTFSSFNNREALTFYLDYERMIGNDGFLKASYGVRRDTGFGFASFSGPAVNNYLNMDGKITYRQHFDFWDTFVTGGLETISGNDYNQSYSDNDLNVLEPGAMIIQEFDIDKFQASPFAQLEVSPLPWLHLTGGARYDDITYYAHNVLDDADTTSHFERFSPKSGLTIDLPYNQKFWFNYSFGYSPPSTSLLFTNTNADSALKPELAENLEVGFRGSMFDETFEYEVAYYNTDVTNFVVNQSIGINPITGREEFVPVNAGKVNLQGLESSFRYTPIQYVRLELAHTYSVNKFVEFTDDGFDYSGHIIATSPEHTVNGRVTFMPIDKLRIEFEVNAMSDYFTNNTNLLDTDGTYQRPTMFNLRTSYDFGPVDWWLHVINLSDERAARVSSAKRGPAPASRSYSAIAEPLTIYSGITVKF
ncbi:MAG: TonB-dependent receptor [Gammaproteobacteria bacterium]